MTMYRRGSRYKGYFKKNNNKFSRPLKTFYGQYEPNNLDSFPNDIWYKTNNEHIPIGIYMYSNGLWRENNPVGMLKQHKKFELRELDFSNFDSSFISASNIKVSTLF